MSRRFLARPPEAPWQRGPSPGRAVAIGFAALIIAFAGAVSCGPSAPSRMAERILDRYRKVSGAKPLPAGGMIHLRLASPSGSPGAPGREEVLWEPRRYRDSVSSAGMTTVRGIESGRAFFIDGDGVTRVASEPVLRELLTRSYFWRRAWLFRDREKALLRLGPAAADSVSVRLDILGGNTLVLAFSRRDGRLLSARSPRFHLEFQAPTRLRDISDPARPVEGEITWTGLPTGRMPSPEVGGGRALFGDPATRVPYARTGGAVVVDARVSGMPVRLAIDGAADGPIALSPALASRLPLRFSTDVFGRSISDGAALEVGTASWPSLFAQVSEAIPEGADAVAGACLFRESVIEIDPRDRRLGLHDPSRWVVPEGYVRIVTDDDDDRPVAILHRGSSELRLTAASDLGGAALLLAAESAERAGLSGAAEASGLTWGPLRLPPLSLRIASEGLFPDWGDDGRLGYALLERVHTFIDMPRRWTYVRPLDAAR
jgi:hypothetical protein